MINTLLAVAFYLIVISADPITGTWTGEIAPDGSPGRSVTFQMMFDGKSAVTGTFTGFTSPGDVKSGTFDPKTGKLKLQIGVQGEKNARLILDGTVSRGIVTGRFTGEMSGTFELTKK